MDKNIFIEFARDVYKLTLLFPKKEPLRGKLREIADEMIAEFILEENDYLDSLRRLLAVADSYFLIAAQQDWVAAEIIGGIKDKGARIGLALDEIKSPQEIANEIIVAEAKTDEGESGTQTDICLDFVMYPEEVKEPDQEEPSVEIICPLPKDLMATITPAVPMVVVEAPLVAEAPDADELEIAKEEELADLAELPDDQESGLTPGQIARQNRIAEFLKEQGSAQVWEIQKVFPNVSKRTIRRDFRSMLKQGLIEVTGERNTTAYKLKITLS